MNINDQLTHLAENVEISCHTRGHSYAVTCGTCPECLHPWGEETWTTGILGRYADAALTGWESPWCPRNRYVMRLGSWRASVPVSRCAVDPLWVPAVLLAHACGLLAPRHHGSVHRLLLLGAEPPERGLPSGCCLGYSWGRYHVALAHLDTGILGRVPGHLMEHALALMDRAAGLPDEHWRWDPREECPP